ncbi:hypothetical protein HDU87_007341 [Geranomyces variabilis]|uniref:Uncharacterized protein n=1 Tax=Geranomyces variabilis TaxID=109894 RepID=A0AAD5TE14_9FUNG|nr:hypothetical protein HDU87_007341 [Geranomyces variabilis]
MSTEQQQQEEQAHPPAGPSPSAPPVAAIEYSPEVLNGSGPSGASLDALGPMVVNADGTLSRITNWDSMTSEEQANITRVLTKRNALRLRKLDQNPEPPQR